MRAAILKNALKVCIGIAIVMVAWLGLHQSPAIALSEDQKLIAEVWRIVSRAYIDETFNHQNWWFVRQELLKQNFTNREEAYQAIQEMLESLEDPYTRLLRPEQYRMLQTNTSGEITGVGLQIAKDKNTAHLTVIAPVEGSPAAEIDIQPKDVITSIDGIATDTLTLDEAAQRMRGRIGTSVILTLKRQGRRPFEISVVRDRISLNPVTAELRSQPDGTQIGYLRLSQFNSNAPRDLTDAIVQQMADGADAYVLDLRNNPGGLLQAGIAIARLWLDDGTIVYTVNRQGVFESFDAFGTAITDAPLAVLVNQGTASASEILAGALQDSGRAALVGETTFGKGLIQSLFDLSDGAGLAVTVAKYETPNHRDINVSGIKPDYRVTLPAPIRREQMGTDDDRQYLVAVQQLQRQLASIDQSQDSTHALTHSAG
ncbi:MAG: carboxyl-terminal processing protease CtpA [Cyanobacteria bacterium P01_C01_bin.73]